MRRGWECHPAQGCPPCGTATCSRNVGKPVQRWGASNQQRPHHPAIFRESAGMSVFAFYSATKHCVVPASTARAVRTARAAPADSSAAHRTNACFKQQPSHGLHAARCHRSIRSRAARAWARLWQQPERRRGLGAAAPQPLKRGEGEPSEARRRHAFSAATTDARRGHPRQTAFGTCLPRSPRKSTAVLSVPQRAVPLAPARENGAKTCAFGAASARGAATTTPTCHVHPPPLAYLFFHPQTTFTTATNACAAPAVPPRITSRRA